MRSTLLFAFTSILSIAPLAAIAQNGPEIPQPSPHARVEQRVGVTDLSVDYSSPGIKGRKVWGTVVPLDQPWRTGANAATKLTSSRDFKFGGQAVPAGTYSVVTIPGKTQWSFILNSDPNTWGLNGYDAKKDVVKVTVKPVAVPQRERLTFSFSDTTDDKTRLDLEWEKLRISVPIEVDTKGQVLTSIEKGLADAWRPHFASARWLLESDGDIERALGYIDTSIAIKSNWWNNWVRAQILAKKGQPSDAIAAGEKAVELGKGDNVYEGFFKDQVSKQIADWKKRKS